MLNGYCIVLNCLKGLKVILVWEGVRKGSGNGMLIRRVRHAPRSELFDQMLVSGNDKQVIAGWLLCRMSSTGG